MTKFRPCIDLHEGKVKQIVGGTLTDEGAKENFVSDREPAWFAETFAKDQMKGGHVIKLGPGNDEAAKEALQTYPKGLQVGGGISLQNAVEWLEAGATHVIVTSWLFSPEGEFLESRLKELSREIGPKQLVIDLSCRRREKGWVVAMNRWQTLTSLEITPALLDSLGEYTDEYLVHAADVEGLCKGIDLELVEHLAGWGKIPMTYAGGAQGMEDLKLVNQQSDGKVDLTIGSALDLFGGNGVTYQELRDWNGWSE